MDGLEEHKGPLECLPTKPVHHTLGLIKPILIFHFKFWVAFFCSIIYLVGCFDSLTAVSKYTMLKLKDKAEIAITWKNCMVCFVIFFFLPFSCKHIIVKCLLHI